MTEPYEIVGGELPPLDAPVLVMMLTGWIDASGAAAAAAAAIARETKASTVVTFDSDTFVDYRARRPTMEVRDGLNSRLVWPSIELQAGTSEGGRDLLLLTGVEPDSAWQRFAAAMGALATDLGVTRAIGLGAYPIGVPHSRPTRLTATTPDPDLLATLPVAKTSVDVPAGIVSLLEHELADRSIPTLTLWAQVPHYVSTMAYPGAAAALLDGLRDVTGIDIAAEELRREAVLQRGRLDALVSGNDEHQAMLAQLERAYDDEEAEAGRTGLGLGVDPEHLPSGDELAAELEKFLRDQG